MLNNSVQAPVNNKWSTTSAIVKRADGSIENRGIIAFSHRNWLINAIGSPLAYFNGWAWERYYRLKRRFT